MYCFNRHTGVLTVTNPDTTATQLAATITPSDGTTVPTFWALFSPDCSAQTLSWDPDWDTDPYRF